MTAQTQTAQTLVEFLASLPPALTRDGVARASLTQVAARVRQELALAVQRGVLPPGTAFSVRSHDSSVDVSITAWSGVVHTPEYAATLADPRLRWDSRLPYLADDLRAAVEAATRIAGRHNYDRSDLMTDYFNVGYYLSVDARPVEARAAHAVRAQHCPAFAQLVEQATAAVAQIGPAAARAALPDGIEAAGEYQLQQVVKLAGRCVGGRPLVYDRRRGWVASSAS